MTILFSDIRSFTTISEKMTPDDNFQFLNGLLKGLGPIIRRNNGYIDKYIGDAVMALFESNSTDAVNASIEIQDFLSKYNESRNGINQVPVEMGIGIHRGDLILGVIGEEERLDGTVISDAVNVASRIESLTKECHAKILISEEAFLEVSNKVNYSHRNIGKYKVKGRADEVSIVEIITA